VASDGGEKVKRFFFSPEICQGCPSKAACLHTKDETQGRTVTLHPQEPLLQQAREYQKEAEFLRDMKLRQRAEHTLARMVQLGARNARYFGRLKTLLQVSLIAAVLNLVIVFKASMSTVAVRAPGDGADDALQSEPCDWPPTDVTPSGCCSSDGMARAERTHVTQGLPNGTRGAPGSTPCYLARGDP
jgi:hypothetical protein